MKNSFLLILVFSISLLSCQSDTTPRFLIAANQVGPLHSTTRVYELDSVFAQDSIVIQEKQSFFEKGKEIVVYNKNGEMLLLLEPAQNNDSTSTIKSIQIIHPQYKTEDGVGTQSTFGQLSSNYDISRIENTLNALVIFIDELNAYVTINKKELPTSLKKTELPTISPEQIPDTAKINFFWIDWQ